MHRAEQSRHSRSSCRQAVSRFAVALILAGCLAGTLVARGEEEAVNDFGGHRTDFDVDGARGFVIAPTAPRGDGTRPWVWYAPTLQRYPSLTLTWLVSRLLGAGFYFCGDNVGETYANPRSREQFTAYYHYVVEHYGLAAKACLMPQSRGGLNHYLFAAAHAEWVQCIAGIYPVADLRSYPGLRRAALAYGLTEDALETHLTAHNPIEQLAPIARAGIPILLLHGDSDRTVPLAENSAAVFARYVALGGRMQLIVIAGEGHKETKQFFESRELLAFLLTQGKDLRVSERRVE